MEGYTELPFWRKRACLLWNSPTGVPTSKLLEDLRYWYSQSGCRSVKESDRQACLIDFLDLSGKTAWNIRTEDWISTIELLELNSSSFSSEEMAVNLGMAQALDYVDSRQELNLDDVMQAHNRVMAGACAELSPEKRAQLSAHICDVHSSAKTLKQVHPQLSERALYMFKLAASSLVWFRLERPFEDGNARVAELFVSNLLKDMVPPGLPLKVGLGDALRKGKMSGLRHNATNKNEENLLFRFLQTSRAPPAGVEDVTALVVEAVWSLWKFRLNNSY